jgi:hypothetical protein
MVRAGEDANESAEHQLETALRLLGSSSRTGGWSAIMSFNSEMRSAMRRAFGVALAERRPDKALKRLHQGR